MLLLRVLVIIFMVFNAAQAETSTSLVVGDPRAQYFLMKRAFQTLYEEKYLGRASEGREFHEYDLSQCGTGRYFLWKEGLGDSLRAWVMLAHDIIAWRNDLRSLGFPEAVWRPDLIKFENDKMAELSRNRRSGFDQSDGYTGQAAFARELARKLTDYRRAAALALPTVTYDPGCGAGEIHVYIKTDPPDARVLFIPAFYYYLCKSQQLDPADPASCNHWREEPTGVLDGVAGDYYYEIRQTNSVPTQPRRLEFRTIQDGDTIILRP